jgi:hypothetical protein
MRHAGGMRMRLSFQPHRVLLAGVIQCDELHCPRLMLMPTLVRLLNVVHLLLQRLGTLISIDGFSSEAFSIPTNL